MNESFEDLEEIALSPINYFELEVPCYESAWESPLQKKHRLPETSDLCTESAFANVKMGWSQNGLLFELEVSKPVEEVLFPDVRYGDSVEFFIDTRDLKSAGFNTRFCHHFAFLPESVEGLIAAEVTHFRTEDAHELCENSDLLVDVKTKAKSYCLHIKIPSHCLHGYNPLDFGRLGFTYRINRPKNSPQHFSVKSDEFPIDQCPSHWSRMRLLS